MSVHLCHARCCASAVPAKLFMCKSHWMKVPKHLRDLVWKLYRPGQEIDKNPSRRYLEVTSEAINAVALHELLTHANRVLGRSGAMVWLHRADQAGKTPFEELRSDAGYLRLMQELHEREQAQYAQAYG